MLTHAPTVVYSSEMYKLDKLQYTTGPYPAIIFLSADLALCLCGSLAGTAPPPPPLPVGHLLLATVLLPLCTKAWMVSRKAPAVSNRLTAFHDVSHGPNANTALGTNLACAATCIEERAPSVL
jgi:hypothetical protein